MSPTTFKMDDKTRLLVEQAAKKRGLKLSAYLREVAREQALRDVGVCGECGRPHVGTKARDVAAA